MKKALILLALLLLSVNVLADIGPSPRNCFVLTNTHEFSDYAFFYTGPIWPDTLRSAHGETCPYKLQSRITVYALKNAGSPAYNTQLDLSSVQKSFLVLKAPPFELETNSTVYYKIVSMDENTKTITLEYAHSSAETDLFFLLNYHSLELIMIAFIALIALGVILIIRKSRK